MAKLAIFDSESKYYIFPSDIPKGLIVTLVIVCLLMGLSGLRKGDWLTVFWQWAFMLIVIPLSTTLVAMPFKIRDKEFELKMAYYLGMFVALLYTLAKLRYWR